MNRRNVLTLGSLAAGGATLLMASGAGAAAKSPTPRPAFLSRPDGTDLYVKDWGNGRAVLFVHSAGVSSDIWTYQMAHLARQGFRCVAYDRRGHGRSSAPGTGYDYDTLADDLGGIIEALNLRNATLVGHSMGCAEIVRYLTRHGASRVRNIALIAPTLPYFLKTPNNPTGIPREYFEKLRAEWMIDYPRWLDENTPPFFLPDTSPAMIHWGKQMAYATELHAALACNVAVTETDFRDELRRIDVPTLIIHGDKDASCPLPLTGALAARLIPEARLEVYEGAPHGLPLTHVARLNAALSKYCEA